MDFRQIQEQIRHCSADTERIYTRMGNAFPSLLSLTSRTDSSSLGALRQLLRNLHDGFSGYREDEVRFFEEYNRKNVTLFNLLNEKMAALDLINERVSAIRTDSEELEIISLNAMVISIKSGEKGRAFSCITENLKTLSARMILLSNALILDEKKLIEKNAILRSSFSTVLDAQKEVLESASTRKTADIMPVIRDAMAMLEGMQEKSVRVNTPIQDAMSGIQLQDIIRQSIDQILLAITEIQGTSESRTVEEKLDQLTLDIELVAVCQRITVDIRKNIEASIRTFADNWDKVHEILDSVETVRTGFISSYLESGAGGARTLPVLLDDMNSGFAEYITRINQYQRGQRTLVKDSSTIVDGVKHLRTLFDTLKPIIARLQHVRITQQIEVAKNSAIHAVQDTVDHMSELIVQADARVQETRKELEAFISDIEKMTHGFTSGSEQDNRELDRIKLEKTVFFDSMQEYQDTLRDSIGRLDVYPESFQLLCAEIDAMLVELHGILRTVTQTEEAFRSLKEDFDRDRDGLLAGSGRKDWVIQNDRLRALVDRFTITAHKEAAGKIGGFDIEQSPLDAIESGDVTLFF